jgi:hypothetical protein
MSDYHVDDQSQPLKPLVAETLWIRRVRLANMAARLDPAEERSIAEEGLEADMTSWPEY